MSSTSSPVDFAFEAPSDFNSTNMFSKPDLSRSTSYSTVSPTTQFTPTSSVMSSNASFPFSSYGLGSASSFSSASFSSASGSGAGSFSSIDALPAISREFARPSPPTTKRPATAHGALQSRSPFAGFMPDTERFSRTARAGTESRSVVNEIIDEAAEGVFTDPFSPESDTKVVPSQAGDVDPHYLPISRRASEPQSSMAQPQLPPTARTSSHPQTFAQPQMYINQGHQMAAPSTTPFNMFNTAPSNLTVDIKHLSNGYNGRPQTSDGIPSFPAHAISLPSARTITGQVFQTNQNGMPLAPPFQMKDAERSQNGHMPFRDGRASSLVEFPGQYGAMPPNAFPGDRAYSFDAGTSQKKVIKQSIPGQGGLPSNTYRPIPQSAVYNLSSSSSNSAANGNGNGNANGNVQYDGDSDEMTFVPLGGAAHKKRPRRRFDEIERLYTCGFGGCEKAYGTLNHLNAHVAMQKHGDKRLPSEFKDLRKAWRKRKREQQAAIANTSYWNGPRGSIGSMSTSSESDEARRAYGSSASADFSRRDSSTSMTGSDYPRGSIYSNGPYGMAPMPASGNPNGPGWTTTEESRPTTSSSMVSSVDERFVPPLPVSNVIPRQGVYYPASGNAQPYYAAQTVEPPRRASMHMNLPSGFRRDEYQTPTQMNPHPQISGAGFPFLTRGVTNAIDVEAVNQGYPGQFAFNR